jgi:hypothetical protein|tara:strand:+ start:82 stop:621 length:540 start_codon:yes stop_codon:yes gene_type:complete
MATVNLLPNGDVSNDWTLSTGSDVYALLDDNSGGFHSMDASKLTASAVGRECIVDLQDFTESHSSIDGVQIVARAACGRGRTFNLLSDIRNNAIPITIYYSENSSLQAASATYRTITYTNRTTYDGSNAWTNAQLNNLRLRFEVDTLSGGTLSFTYCYAIVTYTEPVATDNAIFFGTNF